MNWRDAFLWGFVATIVLTSLINIFRAIGFTRMDIPFMLGTMFTSSRDRAKWIGFVLHLLNGWIFALIYIATFASLGTISFGFGALIGLLHAVFVLTVGMTVLPAIHPRMASEQHGPDPTRQLEPPGFFALNYGRQTPIATILAHVVYGAILGGFYLVSL